MRWGLAFAAVLTAFLCGRLTDQQLGNSGPPGAPIVVASNDSGATGGAAVTPASYGLYVDDLMSSDGNDPNSDLLADNEGLDTDDY